MKASECTLNTRVGLTTTYGFTNRGKVIIEPTTRLDGVEVVVVEWDNGNIQKMEVSSLIPESEVAAEEARFQAEKERLEAEFAVVAAKVKEKADAAAVLINEAQELADAIGKEARYMNDACDLLQEALDNSGWYQSSYSC